MKWFAVAAELKYIFATLELEPVLKCRMAAHEMRKMGWVWTHIVLNSDVNMEFQARVSTHGGPCRAVGGAREPQAPFSDRPSQHVQGCT